MQLGFANKPERAELEDNWKINWDRARAGEGTWEGVKKLELFIAHVGQERPVLRQISVCWWLTVQKVGDDVEVAIIDHEHSVIAINIK